MNLEKEKNLLENNGKVEKLENVIKEKKRPIILNLI